MPKKKKVRKVTFEDARDAMRATGNFKNMKIKLARSSQVKKYREEVGAILVALGFPEALVTDESAVSDFGMPIKRVDAASHRLGVELRGKYLWEAARDLRKKGRHDN